GVGHSDQRVAIWQAHPLVRTAARAAWTGEAPDDLAGLIHLDDLAVGLNRNERGAGFDAARIPHAHVSQVGAGIRPDYFAVLIDLDHLAQNGVADQRVAVGQALRADGVLQALFWPVGPHWLMGGIHLDNSALIAQGVQDVAIGQRLDIMAAVVRDGPQLAAGRPLDGDYLAAGPVVGHE